MQTRENPLFSLMSSSDSNEFFKSVERVRDQFEHYINPRPSKKELQQMADILRRNGYKVVNKRK